MANIWRDRPSGATAATGNSLGLLYPDRPMCVVRGADSSYTHTHTHTHTWPIIKLAAIEMFPYIFAHAKKCLERITHTRSHTPVKCGYTHRMEHDIFLFLTWSTKEKNVAMLFDTHTLGEKFSFCFKLKKKKMSCVWGEKVYYLCVFLFNVVVDTTTFPHVLSLTPHGLSYSLRLTRPDRDPVDKKAAAAAVARRLNCLPPSLVQS